MARATGKTHYVTEDDSFGSTACHRVTRVSPIGQGWGVTSYGDADTARKVAEFLNAHAEAEAH